MKSKKENQNKYAENFFDFFFIKKEVLSLILDSYLEGFTIEEIMWRLQIMEYNFSMQDIDSILDYIINCNY